MTSTIFLCVLKTFALLVMVEKNSVFKTKKLVWLTLANKTYMNLFSLLFAPLYANNRSRDMLLQRVCKCAHVRKLPVCCSHNTGNYSLRNTSLVPDTISMISTLYAYVVTQLINSLMESSYSYLSKMMRFYFK